MSELDPGQLLRTLEIVVPAFLAGLLVLATHVPLGRQVLDRGIVFIDLAVAQVAGLGVVAADFVGIEPDGWSVQASAVGLASVAAKMLDGMEAGWRQSLDKLADFLAGGTTP